MVVPAAAETQSYSRIVCIVNPHSGKGTGKIVFQQLLPKLRSALGERLCDILYTEKERDGTAKAIQAIEQLNADLIVACGGDGHIHDVVNGIMDTETRKARCALALLPQGTGNDFVKSLAMTLREEHYKIDYDLLIDTIAKGRTIDCDVGLLEAASMQKDADETNVRCFFLNEASIGLSADVVHAVNTHRMIINRDFTFQFWTIWKQITYKPRNLLISVDDSTETVQYTQIMQIGNGQYIGSGMQTVPYARINDGKLSVTRFGDIGTWSAATQMLPCVKRGQPIDTSRFDVSYYDGKRFTIRSQDTSHTVFVCSDGEMIGKLPASVSCVPSALRLVVPQRFFGSSADAAAGAGADAGAASSSSGATQAWDFCAPFVANQGVVTRCTQYCESSP